MTGTTPADREPPVTGLLFGLNVPASAAPAPIPSRWPAGPKNSASTSSRPPTTRAATSPRTRRGRCCPGSPRTPRGSGWRPGCSGCRTGTRRWWPRWPRRWTGCPADGSSSGSAAATATRSSARSVSAVPSPRDKVDGLAEAITIIRGLWSQPGFSFEGRRYRTAEADLEPKPGHDIPIWLGTFGDRALAVTGRLADGWIPSLGHASAEQLTVMREPGARRRPRGRPRSRPDHLRTQPAGPGGRAGDGGPVGAGRPARCGRRAADRTSSGRASPR